MSYLSRAMVWLLPLATLVTLSSSRDGHTTSDSNAKSAIPYVDLHVDLPYQYNYEHASFSRGTGQFAASMAREAGLCAVVLPLFVPARVSKHGPRTSDYEHSWERVDMALGQQEVFVRPGVEPAPGQVRTYYSFEGMGPFGDDPQSLERWAARGVRLFGLVHNQDNALAASSMDSHPYDSGLTALGRNVVDRIFELGGVVDVSHASDQTAKEVIEMALHAGHPVVATHSNARQLLDHPRNLPDTLLNGIAETGGVIGVNFHSAFLVAGRRATLADVVKHIVYIAKRVGADHVALGSDFEGDIHPPRGLRTLSEVQHLVPALRAAGLADADIRGIMGANALRILAPRRPDLAEKCGSP